MNHGRLLQKLVLAFWATSLGGVIVDLSTENSMPESLRSYVAARDSAELTSTEMIAFGAAIALFIVFIWSSIDLYKLRMRGRRWFTVSNIAGFLLMPLFGPVVYSGWAAILYDPGTLVSGSIIAVAYLTGALDPPLRFGAPTTIGPDSPAA